MLRIVYHFSKKKLLDLFYLIFPNFKEGEIVKPETIFYSGSTPLPSFSIVENVLTFVFGV